MAKKRFFVALIFTLSIPIVANAQAWDLDLRLTDYAGSSSTSQNNVECVAVSGDTVHVVWYDGRDGNDEIYYKRSVDRGTNWGSDTRLTNSSGASSYPSMAVQGSKVYIAWQDERDGNAEIYFKYSTDAGATWSSDTGLTNDANTSERPSVAVRGDTVHVFWYDNRDGNTEIYYKRSVDAGANWNSDTRLTNNASNSVYPSAIVQGANVYVVWQDDRDGNTEIYCKRSVDRGTNWGSDTRLTNNAGNSIFPSAAVQDTNVYVVWSDARDGNNEIYFKRSADAGSSWGQDARLTNDAAISTYPSIAVSGSDLHVVWKEYRDGNPEIYYKRSVDRGSNWGLDTRLTNDAASSTYPSVACSGSNLHVVWKDSRNTNDEIYYKRGADMQPDNQIKNSNESTYTGDGVYNEDGTDQTSIQTVSAGDTAVYHIRIENDGGLVDTVTVTGDTGADGWEVKYYDALTAGTEITSDITGAGWSTGELDPGEYKEIRVEVVTDDSLPGDSTYDVLITSKSDRDTTKLDAVLARTVIQSGFQPDNQIKNMEETTYIGDGVYNLDGTDQTKSQSAEAGDTVVYHIKIENDGNLPDTFIVTGTAGNAGWGVRYFDALSAGTEITSDVTGTGWSSGVLNPGDTTDIRVELTSPSSATTGTSYDVLVTTTSASDNTRKDAVKATSTVGTSNVEERIEPLINSLNVHPLSDGRITVYCLLAETGTIELSVYDASGRLVKNLATGKENQGMHEYIWNGLDESGKKLAKGVYFIHMSTEKEVLRRRITIVR